MDFELKELGLTLAVGAFTLSGLELVLRYVLNKSLIGFVEERLGIVVGTRTSRPDSRNNKEQAMNLLLFLGLSFLLGLLAEDISYKYEDSKQMPFKELPSMTVRLLPSWIRDPLGLGPVLSRFDSRVSTLVGNLDEKPKIERLAQDLARDHAFSTVDGDNGMKVEEWILSPRSQPKSRASANGELSQEDVQQSITALYYFAKNRVYGIPNYYDEMKRIQSRLEFSRSISMIAFLYLSIALCLSTIAGVYKAALVLNAKRRKKHPAFDVKRKPDSSRATSIEISKKWFIGVLSAVGILFFFYFFGLWAYQRESEAYNKRAFGYFSSMLVAERSQASGSISDSRLGNDSVPPLNDDLEAEAALKKALIQEPRNAFALHSLGRMMVERNDRPEAALDMIQRAVNAEPTNASYLSSLGWAYFKLDKLDEAERYLAEAGLFGPSPAILDHLGDVFMKGGKIPQAREVWQKALRLSTNVDVLARIRAKLNTASSK